MIYKKFTPCKNTIHGQGKAEVVHKTYALSFCAKMQFILHDFFHAAPLLLSIIIMHVGTQYELPTNVKGTPTCSRVDHL